MAESRGYHVLLEKPTVEEGTVEIGLLKNDVRIAVEIYVSMPGTFEIQNLRKCLIAGYDPVVVCSTDRKILESAWKIVETTIDSSVKSKILFLEPENLLLHLDQLAANELSSVQIIKGYRVKVNFIAIPEDKAKAQMEAVKRAVANAIRKRKE